MQIVSTFVLVFFSRELTDATLNFHWPAQVTRCLTVTCVTGEVHGATLTVAAAINGGLRGRDHMDAAISFLDCLAYKTSILSASELVSRRSLAHIRDKGDGLRLKAAKYLFRAINHC